MSDPREELRSYFVEDLEAGDAQTQLPYHLAAYEYLRPHKVPLRGPSADDMEPLNWSREVERKRKELKEVRLKKEAEEKQAKKEQKFREKLSKSLPESELPFNALGVRLEVLRSFVQRAVGGTKDGPEAIDGLSCEEIYKNIRKFLSSNKVKSFTDYLESIERRDLISNATFFISYSNSTKYTDLLVALEDYFGNDEKPQFVWIDMLCRQHQMDDSGNIHQINFDPAWFRTTFPDSLQRIGSVLLIYDDPDIGRKAKNSGRKGKRNYDNPLMRTWCLYELQCALQLALPLDIALVTSEKEMFEDYIKDPTPLLQLIARVDITDSYCSNAKDEARIVGYIDDVYYAQEVNNLLRGRLRRWIVEQLAHTITNISGDSGIRSRERFDNENNTQETSLSRVVSTARRLRDKGQGESAVILVESAMKYIFSQDEKGGHKGDDEERERSSKIIAAEKAFMELWDESYSKKEAHPPALCLRYLENILTIKQTYLPSTSSSIADTLRQLGRVTASEGKHFEKAVDYCTRAMTLLSHNQLEAKEGPDSMRIVKSEVRASLADLRHLLGQIHIAQGDRVNAAYLSAADAANGRAHQIEFFRQIRELEEINGKNDNTTLVWHYHQAVHHLKIEVDIRQRIVSAAPARACPVEDEQLSLSSAWSELGRGYSKLQNGNKAAECYREAQMLRSLAVAMFERDGQFDVSASIEQGKSVSSKRIDAESGAEAESKAYADSLTFAHDCYEEGACYFAQQDYMKALQFFQKALHFSIRKDRDSRGRPDDNSSLTQATAHVNIALVYDCMGDYAASVRHLEEALDLRLETLGEQHPDVAAAYNCLGLVHEALADNVLTFDEAESLNGDEKATEKAQRAHFMEIAQRCYKHAQIIREGLVASGNLPLSFRSGRGREMRGVDWDGGDSPSRSRSASPQSLRSVQTRWKLKRLKF